MRFEGTVQKDGRFWLAEIPALFALTQGRTKREALEMAADFVETVAGEDGFEAFVESTGRNTFEIGANQVSILVAVLLRRQREKHGLTLMDVADRLGQRSPNAYARYEQGRATPTVEQLERLLRAVAPDQRVIWRFVA